MSYERWRSVYSFYFTLCTLEFYLSNRSISRIKFCLSYSCYFFWFKSFNSASFCFICALSNLLCIYYPFSFILDSCKWFKAYILLSHSFIIYSLTVLILTNRVSNSYVSFLTSIECSSASSDFYFSNLYILSFI